MWVGRGGAISGPGWSPALLRAPLYCAHSGTWSKGSAWEVEGDRVGSYREVAPSVPGFCLLKMQIEHLFWTWHCAIRAA